MSELRRFALEEGSDLVTLVDGLEQRAPLTREPTRVVERTVYDTFDWRLHAEDSVLELERIVPARRPRKGSAPVRPWLIWRSTETGEVLGRVEVDDVPTFTADLPDSPVADRLRDIVEMRALRPLVTVRSEQTALRLLDAEGKTEARVVIEQAELVGRDEVLPPTVEVVPVRGYPRGAERVADLLTAQVVLRPVEADVVEAAVELVGFTPGDYSSKLKVTIDPSATALDAVVTVLRALLVTMELNEPGTRADVDSEFLHDYRVAVRRTRSVLAMASGVVPPARLADLRAEFKWLGDITTPTRDFDVYVLGYPDFEASLPLGVRRDLRPLRSFLVDHQRQSQAQLVAELDSPRYADLLGRYRAWLDEPTSDPDATNDEIVPDAATPAAEFAAARTWKAYRRVVRDGRRITPASPPESLHDLRKDAKKLRYALECFGSLFPSDEVAPLVKELKVVQDVLGEFQDCEVQKGSLRGFGQDLVDDDGRDAAPTLLAMGYLIEQLDERERVARDQFAERFARFDAHHQRARFRRLFAPPPEPPEQNEESPDMSPRERRPMKVLATYNIKGGVGKTATAVNLAYLAAAEGARTLVWDLDPQGAASFYFRVKPKVKGGSEALITGRRAIDRAIKGTDFDNLDLLPADFSYRNMDLDLGEAKKRTRRIDLLLRPMAKIYDYVFLDCPPSISLVSENVFRASDALLVPLIPTTLSIRTFDQLDSFLEENPGKKKQRVLAFWSMVDNRKSLHRELIEQIGSARSEVLTSQIPSTSDIERMGVNREPVPAIAPRSRSALAYRELWAEILTRL